MKSAAPDVSATSMLREPHSRHPHDHHRNRDQPSQLHGVAPDRRHSLNTLPPRSILLH
jgi:hypothetical protein